MFNNPLSNIGEQISDTISNRTQNFINREMSKWSPTMWQNVIASEANNHLNKMRSTILGATESMVDGFLDDARNLAYSKISDISGGIYSSLKNKYQKDIDNAVKVGTGMINSAKQKVSDFFGLNSASTNNVAIASYLPNTFKNVQKLFNTSYLNEISDKDPLDIDVHLGKYVMAIVEDSGYIADVVQGEKFSKNFIFIKRPVMEIDNSGPCRSFAFLTRPNCNLVTLTANKELTTPDEMSNYSDLRSSILTDLELYSELCRDNCNKGNIFHLLNNYIVEIPPIRLAETDRDGVKNMYNMGIPIPGMPVTYSEVDIPITFADNGRGDISKLLYTLSMYKHYTGSQGYPMRKEYIRYKAIDYLMSLYIVTVNSNWEIIGFAVGLGLMIAEPPTHFIRHNIEGFQKNDLLENFTVNFKCSSFFPYAPWYYDTFNRLTGFDPSYLVDTRGSSSSLYHDGRATTSKDTSNKRSSVFSASGGYDPSKTPTVQGSTNVKHIIGEASSKILDFLNVNNSEYRNNVANVTTVMGNFTYKDHFEMLATAAGVYIAYNSANINRRIFKLGFSF